MCVYTHTYTHTLTHILTHTLSTHTHIPTWPTRKPLIMWGAELTASWTEAGSTKETKQYWDLSPSSMLLLGK